MRRSLRVLASAVGLALAPWLADATVMLAFGVEDLARRAEIVAIARVDSVEARWETGRSAIRTYSRLTLERAIAGKAPATIEISVLGGTVDGITATTAGVAELRKGDRVVVFLERRMNGSNEWLVTGSFQGAFRVELEVETGMDVAVRRSPRDVAFAGGEILEPEVRLYVDELEARVRAVRGAR